MAHSLNNRAKGIVVLALVGVILLLGLLGSTNNASAATASNYCAGQTLPGFGRCFGAERSFVALEGWGADHSVCVAYRSGGSYFKGTCSAGGGSQITYWPVSTKAEPAIENNAAGSNLVTGVAWQECC